MRPLEVQVAWYYLVMSLSSVKKKKLDFAALGLFYGCVLYIRPRGNTETNRVVRIGPPGTRGDGQGREEDKEFYVRIVK